MDCIQSDQTICTNTVKQANGICHEFTINVNQIWLADNIIFIVVTEKENDIVELKIDTHKFRLTPDRNCVINIKNTKTEERLRHITFRINDIITDYGDLNFELTLRKNNHTITKKFSIKCLFLWFFPKIKEIK